MPIFQFPYDSQKTRLRSGNVHLARATVNFTLFRKAEVPLAVDYDSLQPYPFTNTVLHDGLMPMLIRATNLQPLLIDLTVSQHRYARVPSLLLELRLKSTNLQTTPAMRVRVFFSQQILQDHFALLPGCDGVFGRSDFPTDVTCSATMTDFVATWP
jgi:hypothetical protein